MSARSGFLILLLCTAFLPMACKDDITYKEIFEIPEAGWDYEHPAHFSFEVRDTSRYQNMILNVTHTPDYEWQNLYVKIYTDFPKNRRDTQILSIELADKTGKWFGKRSGDGITAPILLQERFRFEDPGNYKLRIEQNMRKNPLKHVRKLELMLQTVTKATGTK